MQRRLGQWAIRRPHVLMVTAPGGTAARLAVERGLRTADGVLALSPADADLLVVAGSPGVELSSAIDSVWQQIPAPRIRVDCDVAQAFPAQLRAALGELAHVPPSEPDDAPPPRPSRSDDHADPSGHDAHDLAGHDMGEMEMPGGLPMADRAADRDGLRLDVLHVPLGPVLLWWPAGLVIDAELQGDLIQTARSRLFAGIGRVGPYWSGDARPPERLHPAAHLDSLGRLLAVCGWIGPASEAALLRDALLTNTPVSQVRSRFERLRRHVERSRSLRLATAGLGRVSRPDCDRLGVSGPAARAVEAGGDATARYLTWLEEIDHALAGHVVAPAEGPRGKHHSGSPALLSAAVELVAGLDLAAARVVMASLDPDPDELAGAAAAGGRCTADEHRAST